MYAIKKFVVLLLLVTAAVAQSVQSPQPPLSNTRISVNTLLREDIFAGFIEGDMERFSRGEKNLALLLEQRPAEKPTLIAWSASTHLYRAVIAHESNRPDEFKQRYQKALDLYAEANKLSPNNGGVLAITGGSYAIFGDRLPAEHRSAAWSQAYDSYKFLWKFQGPSVEQLPLHLRGELLAGLAQSAQRTGRTEEMNQYLDKILAVLPNTPYEPVAKRWKANPEAAAKATITCLSCHDAGRLSARIEAVKGL